MTCEVNNIFVVMTLTLYSKFLNQTYGVRTPTFTIHTRAETKTTTLVRAGGGAPFPPSPTNVDKM